ncbi:MAG TPA: DNA-binding protein Alba [Candidatus Pacearchaeota archaeon]|jgi:DNA-binding protein|nr:DNA-binding protein Alba [Candidatus Pacearchaeota archaeon]
MVEEKKQIDEDKIVENSSEDENIGDSKKDNSEKSEVVEKEKSRDNVEKGNDNVIFVGIKPFMNYVTGVVMQFQNKGQDEVIVSARGKFISKAVDVVEVARRTFLKDEDIKIENIGINSEQFENKEGKRIFVSTIEIKLVKN